jgi:hypothetical protein
LFAAAYRTQAQEVFLDGHVRAFEYFGGVPARIRYDNLKAAVTDIVFGRQRKENERFVALRSFYGFDAFFCRPGVEGAHEKGGVEGGIGYFRRNYLTPVPKIAAAADVDRVVAVGMAAELDRVIAERTATIGCDLDVERGYLAPLAGRFEAVSVESRKVDGKARVAVRGAKYSVPVSLVGRRVQVVVGAATVTVRGPDGGQVAVHERLPRGEHLVLDHYLEVLARKPGALLSSVPLATARAEGWFGVEHQRWWDLARRQLGDQAGTRALIEVLLGARRVPADALRAALDRCRHAGVVQPDAVLVEARLVCETGAETAPVIVDLAAAAVVAGLQRVGPPSLDRYDELARAA